MGANGAGTAPRILGLTGSIACGKSTVGDMLLEMGALERIDADRVVHELMEPGTETSAAIRDRFGEDVMLPDGGIDRARLGEVVFAGPETSPGRSRTLADLESIIHPAVRTAIRRRVAARAGQQGIIVVDAVKLLQSELLELCDAVWVVRCAPDTQLHRLMQIRNMTERAARGRLAAQPSFDHPSVMLEIDNSGSRDDLHRQVEAAWQALHHELEVGPGQPPS